MSEAESEAEQDAPRDMDSGQPSSAFFERVYDELHGLAARQMRAQGAGHTLQATALVSELYLKMGHYELDRYESRAHFIAMAARAMRSILVDHARSKGRKKRSPDGERVALEVAAQEYGERSGDLLALDEALVQLGKLDPRLVELVELRFFGNCSMEECSQLTGRSLRTAQRDWRFAKDWLRQRLSE